MTSFQSKLFNAIAEVASVTPEMLEVLERHYRVLQKWNARLNLTAIRSEDDAVIRHYGESLFLQRLIEPLQASTVVDVGSGAGFPGFPLAVALPSSSFTLVESHQRKSVFLRETAALVTNVRVHAGRFEDLSESFDLAVCRAVAWADIRQIMRNKAKSVALLVSEDDSDEILRDNLFIWSEPVRMPWGNRRVVLLGT